MSNYSSWLLNTAYGFFQSASNHATKASSFEKQAATHQINSNPNSKFAEAYTALSGFISAKKIANNLEYIISEKAEAGPQLLSILALISNTNDAFDSSDLTSALNTQAMLAEHCRISADYHKQAGLFDIGLGVVTGAAAAAVYPVAKIADLVNDYMYPTLPEVVYTDHDIEADFVLIGDTTNVSLSE